MWLGKRYVLLQEKCASHDFTLLYGITQNHIVMFGIYLNNFIVINIFEDILENMF